MEPCKLCGEETKNVYDINFNAVPVCDSCGAAIFIQQAQWYVQQERMTAAERADDVKLIQTGKGKK